MKKYIHKYCRKEELNEWLCTFSPLSSQSILVQLFSGIIDKDKVKEITQTISKEMSEAVIIGTTTSGEIVNGKMSDGDIIISLSIFDETSLKSIHIIGDDFEQMGSNIASSIIDENTKCIIMFADGIKINGEAVLRGINTASSKNIVIAGGMSGDNGKFKNTYCIHGCEVFENGVVAVALSNASLEVFNTYNLSWRPIAKKMIVTKSKGNIVYELDNQPIKDIYAKYLGEKIIKKMPASTIEFPLIMQEDGVEVARSTVSLADNGGIVYAGELPEGKEVRFGIGSPNMLSESSKKSYDLANNNPIESIFVYSCIARKTLLGKGLEAEFHPLSKIAPLSGFFTYGEFFHAHESNKLLNVTTTILGLSETKNLNKRSAELKEEDFNYSSLTINALFNLVEVTLKENESYAQELIKTNKSLQLKNSALNALANAVVITDKQGKIEWANKAFSNLTGYESEEVIGINHNKLIKTDFQDNEFYKSLWKTILSNNIWHSELINHRKDGSLYNEEMTITPMTDENNKIEHFVAVKQDITKRKRIEENIKKHAFYDTLTHLPNRRLLSDRLSKAQAMSEKSKRYCALMFLDLDNFKPLNDTYGHHVGDLLLIEVAHRLNECVRNSDTVARFGGDKFVVLLSELSCDKNESIKQVMNIAQKIKTMISQPHSLPVIKDEDKEETSIIEHYCTSSIGVSIFIEYEIDHDNILKIADSAMYKAKKAGRNQIMFSY